MGTVIRQAISCDICAAEKKQTNHWFVAYEMAGELRISGWNSRNRLRANSKHLCGQTCLHKLVDDFMARSIGGQSSKGIDAMDVADGSFGLDTHLATHLDAHPASYVDTRSEVHGTAERHEISDSYLIRERLSEPRRSVARFSDASLTSTSSFEEDESSARLIPTPALPAPKPASRAASALVRMPAKVEAVAEVEEETPSEMPRHKSRNWRAEAWERERERELRAAARVRSSR